MPACGQSSELTLSKQTGSRDLQAVKAGGDAIYAAMVPQRFAAMRHTSSHGIDDGNRQTIRRTDDTTRVATFNLVE